MSAALFRTSATSRRAIAALVLAICAVVYLRAIVTPIGIQSFGRDFGWYVTYWDFGFVHRALVGSIVALFAPKPVANSFTIPFAVYPLFMLAAAAAAWWAARRWFPDEAERTRYLALLLLSPAFVAHYAYSTGDFNVLLALFLILSLVTVRHRWAPFLWLIPAMPTHELFFVVFSPAICVAIYLADGRSLGRAVAYAAVAGAAYFVFMRFGTIHMSYEDYVAVTDRRAHLYYTGYLEMAGDFQTNVAYTRPLFDRIDKYIRIVPPLIYWAIVATLFFPRRETAFVKLIYAGAAAAPLVLIPFGTDLFRWVSLACVAAILLGGQLRTHGVDSLFAARPRLTLLLTLPWILPGPFGGTCDPTLGCLRLYPMFQFALERIL